MQAMDEISVKSMINGKSCITFLPHTTETDYIRILPDLVDPTRCYSFIGKQKGRQDLVISPGCLIRNNVTHELMHVLG